MIAPLLRVLVPVFTLAIAVGACATQGASSNAAIYADAARNDPRGKPYVIGVADVLRISVWKTEDLSTDAVVCPDGTITMPVVGALQAAGRTASQLQQDVAQRLATIVKDVVVTLSVVEVNSYRFTVAGNVEHPGLFSARSYLKVSEAIALAGGPNRYASPDQIVILRTAAGRATQRIPINYDDILSGKSPEQDIVILAGDAVRVP